MQARGVQFRVQQLGEVARDHDAGHERADAVELSGAQRLEAVDHLRRGHAHHAPRECAVVKPVGGDAARGFFVFDAAVQRVAVRRPRAVPGEPVALDALQGVASTVETPDEEVFAAFEELAFGQCLHVVKVQAAREVGLFAPALERAFHGLIELGVKRCGSLSRPVVAGLQPDAVAHNQRGAHPHRPVEIGEVAHQLAHAGADDRRACPHHVVDVPVQREPPGGVFRGPGRSVHAFAVREPRPRREQADELAEPRGQAHRSALRTTVRGRYPVSRAASSAALRST